MKRALAAVAFALVVLVAAPAAAQKIKEIEVVENTKTSDETVKFIAGIEKGDTWDVDMAETIQRKLVSSGLFKDVDVFTTPIPGGVRVTLVAKDKFSWVIAPTAYNQPTNKGGGLGFGENNLFGENKKLLLYGQVATGDSFFIGAYVDPSIANTRFQWQYDVFLRRERVFEYAPPSEYIEKGDPLIVRQSKMNYLNSGIRGGVTLFDTVTFSLRLRGAYVYYDDVELGEDATVEDVGVGEGDPIPAPGTEGWDVSGEAILEYDGTGNWYGVTSGDMYKFTFEHAMPGLGSEFEYWYASARYTRARKYFSRHNLVMKTFAGYGKDMPFQQEYTSGGTDLRGYKNRQFRGNLRLAGTVEYSVPLFTIKGLAFRALTFLDTTYTTFLRARSNMDVRNYLPGFDDRGDNKLAPFRNTVGVGTRLYVRQIVLPLLGLDLGYGLERHAYEIYFAIGLTGF